MEVRNENVRSVERALSILVALAECRSPMSGADLAAQMDLHPATVHRILTTLVRNEWISQNEDTSRYRLGTKALGIGAVGFATHPLLHYGQDALRRLSATSECTSYLSVLVGGRVVYLARAYGPKGMNLDFQPGASQPAYCTADGKLLLAYLPEADRVETLRRLEMRAYTAHTLPTREALEVELEQIHSQGYAVDRQERWDFLAGVAVPVMDGEENLIGSLSSYGRLDLTTELTHFLRQELTLVAEDLAHRLEVS
jgi:IclR family transcriptional regulator, KDG regulon repressor